MYDFWYIKGLLETLRSINNGRCVHEKANVMQTLVFYVSLSEKGMPVPGNIEDVVQRAKKLIKQFHTYPKNPNQLYDPDMVQKN